MTNLCVLKYMPVSDLRTRRMNFVLGGFNRALACLGHHFSQNGTALGFLPQRQRRDMQKLGGNAPGKS
jgi:hypothetical protein